MPGMDCNIFHVKKKWRTYDIASEVRILVMRFYTPISTNVELTELSTKL